MALAVAQVLNSKPDQTVYTIKSRDGVGVRRDQADGGKGDIGAVVVIEGDEIVGIDDGARLCAQLSRRC